jgi:hypothetical protein
VIFGKDAALAFRWLKSLEVYPQRQDDNERIVKQIEHISEKFGAEVPPSVSEQVVQSFGANSAGVEPLKKITPT